MPGCPRRVRSGRCREHSAERKARERASGARQVYSDPRWTRARARAIARAGGRCQALEPNGARCVCRARLSGHHAYEGGVEQLLRDGGDPFDERWIVILCPRHHGLLEAWLRGRDRLNQPIRR